MPIKPPQLATTFTVGHTLRYQANAAGTVAVTRKMLLQSLVMVTTTGSTAYRLFSGVKLRRIKMWSNPPGVGSAINGNLSVAWYSEQGPTKLLTDTGVGSTFGARLQTKPPPQSLASFWSLGGTDEAVVLFDILFNSGDIIDIDITAVMQNAYLTTGAPEVPVSIAVNSGTVGQVAMLFLDNNGAGATKLPAVGYSTIS